MDLHRRRNFLVLFASPTQFAAFRRSFPSFPPFSPPFPLTSSQAPSIEAIAASSFSRLIGSVNSISRNARPPMSSLVRYTRRRYSKSSLGYLEWEAVG